MKKLIFVFLFFPNHLTAQQKRIAPVFGFAFNKGFEKIYPEDRTLDVNKVNIIGYYVSAGLNIKLDSTFIFYTGIRYGRENSRFMIQPDSKELYYRTSSLPLSFIFAPGIKINKHHLLFLSLGITRVLQANNGGGGGGTKHGKEYSFLYVTNLPQNSWDFRPGLKWQIKLRAEKKFAFEFGVEPSLVTRKIEMKVKNTNPNLPETSHRMSYDLILFYTGIIF